MAWYWFALLLGVGLPWVVMSRAILTGFREKGLQGGLGVWFGAALLTVPIAFVIMWLVQAIR